MSLVMPVCLLQGAYLECHSFEVTEYPGGDGIHAGGIYARDGTGVDQPSAPALDVILFINMSGMAMSVAHQVVITSAGKSLSVVWHMGDEYFAPAELQHGFLAVIGKQATGLLHSAVQCRDIADVVAVDCVDGNAELKRSAQCVDADQVAAVYDRLCTSGLSFSDGRDQRGGAVMAVGYNTDFHVL